MVENGTKHHKPPVLCLENYVISRDRDTAETLSINKLEINDFLLFKHITLIKSVCI